MSNQHYSIIIIGGGPIGIACALEAEKHNIDYLIIEKGTVVNSLYNYPVNMTFFSTSERLEIGNVPFVSNNPKPTRSEALEYYRRVAADKKINIHLFEEVKNIDQQNPGSDVQEISYSITTTKNIYTSTYIIMATGFYDIPYMLNVPGEELPKVMHYYKDPHLYAFQNVAVVGANNSAVDAALETWRKGANVTMIIRQQEIGERVKYWVKPDIENRIKEGSIKAYFNSVITEIREKEIDMLTPEGSITIQNDWVLAMTGYQPNLSFLKKIGIELCNDEVMKPTYKEDTHETNQKNIYLAGVVCGGMNTHRLFIENSREHAINIIKDIKNRSLNNIN